MAGVTDIAIVGGGIGGASLAFALARLPLEFQASTCPAPIIPSEIRSLEFQH